ncbi:hypothetical protein MSAN_01033200 [Mycena sanguinolenta]|uniref:Thiamine-binding protein domain-containing protein n=1 Tax=Mycena sanguinolenta TaxID=230812 RepID=A0A8H6YSG7_9AGAR|nr:hypothetical protein MSAN_01033200 [Mycena sanguinolenta]
MSDDLYAVAGLHFSGILVPTHSFLQDFCLIPIGTGEPSVAEYIAECQRILQKSGLTYKVISSSKYAVRGLTPRECLYLTKGPWSAVSKAIHDCHAAVHARGAPRVATDIRIGTRIDREISPGTGNDHKVRRVEEILEKDSAST